MIIAQIASRAAAFTDIRIWINGVNERVAAGVNRVIGIATVGIDGDRAVVAGQAQFGYTCGLAEPRGVDEAAHAGHGRIQAIVRHGGESAVPQWTQLAGYACFGFGYRIMRGMAYDADFACGVPGLA